MSVNFFNNCFVCNFKTRRYQSDANRKCKQCNILYLKELFKNSYSFKIEYNYQRYHIVYNFDINVIIINGIKVFDSIIKLNLKQIINIIENTIFL